MELQHLRTFIAVADAGSLTRAGEVLHLSQPAVSAQVKSLEIETGLALFRRTSRGMAVTDAGEELLEQAREIVRRTDGLLRTAERLGEASMGELRLGVIPCGYDLRVATAVGKLTVAHPEVEVKMNVANSAMSVSGVIDQTLDVAFAEIAGDVTDERLAAYSIGSTRIVVVGPRQWESELANKGWAGLAEFPWIFQSEGCSYHGVLAGVMAERNVSLKPRFEATAFGSVKDLVAGGLGLSLCDREDVAELVAGGDLFVWPHYEYVMPVKLVAHADRVKEPLIAAFIEVALGTHDASRRRRARPVGSGART